MTPERPWQDPKERELEARDPEQYRLGLEMAIEGEQDYRREIQAAYEAEKERATKDALTGLENRNGLKEKASAILARLGQEHGKRSEGRISRLTVMILDVDFFKKINDTYGHEAGDMVLRAVADQIRELLRLRPTDVAARYGGEEFVILFPDASPGDILHKFGADSANGTPARFQLEVTIGGKKIAITLSGGVTAFRIDDPEETLGSALKRADADLYRAKESGRNRILGDEKQNGGEEPGAQPAAL